VAGVEDDHVTELVRFAVEPSEYTPIAASCWVSPTGTLAAAGVIVTATNTFGSTVITAVPERAAAESVAVIVAAPVATAVTRPVEDTVAVPVLDDDHVTTSVKLAVEPSE
jgi:formylmethanofuran dehydrogenase subunit D